MAREIPEAVRAAAGLAATVLDEARNLPRTLPALPVRALGAVMQVTLKLQQHWSGLVARGDELLTGLRGQDEPGLATFDEDLEPAAGGSDGFRSSAFDRVEVEDEAALVRQLADEVAADAVASDDVVTDEEVARLPEDPAADAVVAAVEDMAHEIEGAEQVLEQLDEDTPVTAGVDELETALLESESGPGEGGTSPDAGAEEAPAPPDPWGSPVAEEQAEPEPAGDLTAPGTGPEDAPPEGSVDVVGADGEVTTAEAAVTDEGVATVETDQGSTEPPTEVQDESGGAVAAATGVRTDVDETTTDADADTDADTDTDTDTADADTADADATAGTEGSAAAGASPVPGYDAFSIAQLRGHLRGYQQDTVSQLLTYEQATRDREPFVRMLRNRLERLERDAASA